MSEPLPSFSLPPPPDFRLPIAPVDGLVHARRAARIMFALCGLLLVIAGMAYLASNVPLDQIPPQQRPQIDQIVAQMGMPFKVVARTFAAMVGVPGVVLGVLGLCVRGAQGWAIIAAILFDALMLLFMAGETAMSVEHQEGLAGIAPPLLLGALLCWLMTELIAAFKAGKRTRVTATQVWAAPEDDDDY